MNDSTQAMVDLLRERYRSSIDTHENIFTAVANGQIGVEIGGSREAHTRIAHQSLREAESVLELFEHTIVAHLGTAGPMGAIAEQQLRILAPPFLQPRPTRVPTTARRNDPGMDGRRAPGAGPAGRCGTAARSGQTRRSGSEKVRPPAASGRRAGAGTATVSPGGWRKSAPCSTGSRRAPD
ncbi:hypothetical protein ACFU7Y_40070 [Kitasatospora sp. NPDC057542]|uniref:hypothetical protein n=1 Tax=Kitasatospora sp. NPDC057542 TaxID=3346162 RepID=UPI0036C325CB